MSNAIGLNLPTAPSVDVNQAISVSGVGASPITASESLKQGDGGFLEVLNAELEALADDETVDLLALANVGELDNIEGINESTELDIANTVLADIAQEGEDSSELLGLSVIVEADATDESALDPSLELAFKEALLELPDNVTALPLTPENKAFILQQALTLVEQKHPEMMAKLQQTNGQALPLEGKLLPLVDEILVAQETLKPIQVATLSAAAMAQNLSPKELSSESGNKETWVDMLKAESDPDTELSLKNAIAPADLKGEGLKDKQLLENMLGKNVAQTDVPAQKLTKEMPSTVVSNALNINQASITNPTPAAIQSGGTLLLPQNPTTDQWGNALGAKLQWMINTKLETAEIRIDPPHLGKMNITIKMTDDGASVVIQTQLAATRDLLDAASYRLKEMLEGAGYDKVDVDVSHQENNQTDSQFAENEESHDSGLASNQDAEEAQTASANDVIAGTLNNGRGGLDLFV